MYKYTYAVTQRAAEEEARQVVALLQSYGLENTMVWWDVEDRGTLRTLSPAELTDCIREAQAVVEAAGFRFGLYVGLYVYKERWFDFNRFAAVQLWVARYPNMAERTLDYMPAESDRPSVGRALWGWQYSSNGRVPGIAGAVDLNICYQDPEEPELAGTEWDVIWCVSIADVWEEGLARAVAAAYPGCRVHKVLLWDADDMVIWIASVADVWTQAQAKEAQRQLAEIGIVGVVHKVQVLE